MVQSTKSRLILVGLFCTLLASSVVADDSPAYKYYMKEAMSAFTRHDDARAARFFRNAQRVDPTAKEPQEYLGIIEARGKDSRKFLPARVIQKQVVAIPEVDAATAQPVFDSVPVNDYGNKASVPQDVTVERGSAASEVKVLLDQYELTLSTAASDSNSPLQKELSDEIRLESKVDSLSTSVAKVEPIADAANVTDATAISQSYVSKKIIDSVALADIVSAADRKGSLRLEAGSELLVEGYNFRRFLLIEQEPVKVALEGRDKFRIKAIRRGSTFIHLWDDSGRWTLFVEVVPMRSSDSLVEKTQDDVISHESPFRFHYDNTWSTYRYGDSFRRMHRNSLDMDQRVGVDGPTPYGHFDAAATFSKNDQLNDPSDYTMGLTNIPFKGTKNFDLRVFNAARWLSPLTLPGSRLRGVFADVTLFQETVAMSLTHGRLWSSFSYYTQGRSRPQEVYIDAARFVLMPHANKDNYYRLNLAQSYGDQREEYYTKHAVSVEAQHKKDQWTINGELARDDDTNAGIAGVKWENGPVRSQVNVRDINKGFTTVRSALSGEGEVGAVWSTSANFGELSMDSAVDVYRERIDFNPQDRQEWNLDANYQLRYALTKKSWINGNALYTDTSGEYSPRTHVGVTGRLSRWIDVWGGRKATIYMGMGYQQSRFAFAPLSEYDRISALTGFQLPLTTRLSIFSNYEHSWVNELASGIRHQPDVYNTGLNYSREITRKLSGSLSLAYRNESRPEGTNSFLSGEDSASGAVSLTYRAKEDVEYFFDSRVRDVWSQVLNNPSYNDMDMRVGIRAKWGGPLAWDPRGMVEGYVFKDNDANSKFDVGDTGLKDVVVMVGNTRVETDSEGRFYAPIAARRVKVMPLPSSLSAGLIFTTPAMAHVDIKHKGVTRVDFGFSVQTGVYGIVFVDRNANGIPDQGDRYVGKIKIKLDKDDLTASDSRGVYTFKRVSPGTHVLSVDVASIPMDLMPAVKVTNTIEVAEGSTYIFHIPLKSVEKE